MGDFAEANVFDLTELQILADAEKRLLGVWAATAGISRERLLAILDARATIQPGERRALVDAVRLLRTAARRERRRRAH